MPFLTKEILIELLNTYTGEDLAEKKSHTSRSFFTNLVKLADSVINTGKTVIGINTKSEQWYLRLRNHISKATDDNNLNAWGDLIIDSGKAAFHTASKSYFGSHLCQCAMALRSYILNKVNLMLKTIPYRRLQILKEDEEYPLNFDYQTLAIRKKGIHLILYWNHNNTIASHSLKISDVKDILKKFNTEQDSIDTQQIIYDILLKFFSSPSIKKNDVLTSDQILALQIRDALNTRIDEQKRFIVDAKKNIARNKSKTMLEFKNLETNEEIEKYEKNSEENIKIRQRNLCYLNAYDLLKLKEYQLCHKEPERLITVIRKLFPKFQFYNFSSTELSDETTKHMNSDLPLYLQPNYDSIYLRSKESDPKKEQYTDDRVVTSFEQKVIENNPKNKNAKTGAFPQAPLPSLPNRTLVPTLSNPFDDLEDDEPPVDPDNQKLDDTQEEEVDDKKTSPGSHSFILTNLGPISELSETKMKPDLDDDIQEPPLPSVQIEDEEYFAHSEPHEIAPKIDQTEWPSLKAD